MFHDLTVTTSAHRQFLDITAEVNRVIRGTGARQGICLVFSPHTTAALTLNENADPDVQTDLLRAFVDLIGDEDRFSHAEGNSGGHALTSLIGPSVVMPIRDGALRLGRWQAVYLCELDGPRQRTVTVQVVADGDDRGGSS